MLATVHSIIFLSTLFLYLLLSLALLYHWYKYTINPNVFLFTTIIYLGLTASLSFVMAVSIMAM